MAAMSAGPVVTGVSDDVTGAFLGFLGLLAFFAGPLSTGTAGRLVAVRSEAEFSRVGYKEYQQEKSRLTVAGIPCIQPFALDYMHLVCLGVVRRMLHWMINGPVTCKLSFQQRNEISDNLKSFEW